MPDYLVPPTDDEACFVRDSDAQTCEIWVSGAELAQCCTDAERCVLRAQRMEEAQRMLHEAKRAKMKG